MMGALFSSLYGASLRGGGMMGIEVPQSPMLQQAPPQAAPQQAPAIPPQAQAMPPQAQQVPPPAGQPQPQPNQSMNPQIMAQLSEKMKTASSIKDVEEIAEALSNAPSMQLKEAGKSLMQKIEQDKSEGKSEQEIVDDFKRIISGGGQPQSKESAEG